MDRFIVKVDVTKDEIWWGDINIPFDSDKFDALYNKVTEYLSGKEIYARDSYVCSDPNYRLNVRVVTEYPWSNLFCHNMFLRPEQSELENFACFSVIRNSPSNLFFKKVQPKGEITLEFRKKHMREIRAAPVR